MTGTEEWREISGFPAYEVSSEGGIRRQDNARPLCVTPGSNGYPRVNLGDSGRDKLVHQLVMEAFAGPAPDGMEVRHLDGDPANNHWAPGSTEEEVRAAGGNLFYGTHERNMQDSIVHGTRAAGSRNGNSRLTEPEVAAIRDEYRQGGVTQRALAAKYSVSQRTIWNIVNETQWRQSLTITRGLPRSGKSTWAAEWVREDPAHRAEVNRDLLRLMMHGGYADAEQQVTTARDAMVTALLGRGVSVVCSDTNLPQRVARDLARLAKRANVNFHVKDLTCVPLADCLDRNAARTDKAPVPDAVIRDMHARYLAGRSFPLPLPEEPASEADGLVLYVPKPGTPKAVLVDIDGTTALMASRSPFDETRVHEDRPNAPVIAVIRAMAEAGNAVVFLSGRTDACRAATHQWLLEHVRVPFQALHMRPAGDMRKDAIVKRELFDRHVRDRYDVVCVLDDRDQVVAAWRELGLTCLQVAPGNF